MILLSSLFMAKARGQDAGALVRNLQEVQKPLHGAVLPAPPVHDDQGRVQLFGILDQSLQVGQGIIAPDVVFGLD